MRMTALFGDGDGVHGRQRSGAIAAWILHSFYSKCNMCHVPLICTRIWCVRIVCTLVRGKDAHAYVVLVILYLLYLCMVKTCVVRIFFGLGSQVLRHSAGGVGSSYMRMCVHGTFRLQCPCVSNGSRELCHSYLYIRVQSIYSTDMVVQKWLLVLHMHMNILTRTVNT